MKKICFSCAGVVIGGYALFFALSFIGAGIMAFVAMFLYLACIVVICTHLILKALHENREKTIDDEHFLSPAFHVRVPLRELI